MPNFRSQSDEYLRVIPVVNTIKTKRPTRCDPGKTSLQGGID